MMNFKREGSLYAISVYHYHKWYHCKGKIHITNS